MANPATKNGYLKLANELTEAFARTGIHGSEMRVLWVVMRKTWGWKKEWDKIAFSQFLEGTGMKNGNVSRALKTAVACRLLNVGPKGYQINQDYSQWQVAKRLPRASKNGSPEATEAVAPKLPTGSPQATESVAYRRVSKERKKLQKKTKGGSSAAGVALEPASDAKIGEAREARDIIEAFGEINPACKKMYGNTSQRAACADLVREYGFERVLFVVQHTLPKTNAVPYMPTILTPHQLFQDWKRLESALHKAKEKARQDRERTETIQASKGRGVA